MNEQDKSREELLAELNMLRQRVVDLEREGSEPQPTSDHVLRQAVEYSTNSIVVTDRDSNIQYVNAAFIQLTGYTAEEVIGRNPRVLQSGQTPPEIYAAMWDTLTSGQPWRGELCNRKKNGEIYWESAVIMPVLDDSGAIVQYIAVKEDITARRRTARALHESQEHYRELVEMSPDLVMVLQDAVVQYTNPALIVFLGLNDSAQLVGRSIHEHVHPDSLVLAKQRTALLAAGIPVPLQEIKYTRQDGAVVAAELAASPIEYHGQPAVLVVGRDITDRKEVEATLRASEARFRGLVESMDDIVFTLDTHQRHTGVYGRWVTQMGFKPEHFLGKTAREIMGPEAAQIHEQANLRALAGDPVTYEWQIPHDDGVRHYQTVLSPLRDEDGSITGLVGVGRDITERKQAEAALRASEEQFRTLAENAPLPISIMTAEEEPRFLYANAAWKSHTGYTGGEMQALDPWELIHPDMRALVSERVAALISGEDVPTSYEIAIRTKTGEQRWIDLHTVMTTYHGQAAIITISNDITERKRVEDALRASEEQFRTLAENAPTPISIMGGISGERYLYVNPSWENLTGYTREEAQTLNPMDIVDPSMREVVADRARARLRGEPVESRYELVVVTKSGEQRWSDFRAVAIEYQGQTAILSIANDITERKRVEDALRKTEERYALAQRAASVGSWDWDIPANELHWSEHIEPMFGFAPGGFGKTYEAFMECVHPDDRQPVIDALNACLYEGADYDIEHRIIWPDGSLHWMLERGAVQRDESGAPVRMLGVVQDITARKQAEAERRESEERYRRLIELTPDAILVHTGGIVRYTNLAGLALLAIDSPGDLVGRDVVNFVHPHDRALSRVRIAQLDRGEPVPLAELRLLRSDGAIIYAEVISAPITYMGEAAALVVLRDITERKAADRALYESQAIARALVNAPDDVVLVLDQDGIVHDCNARAIERLQPPGGRLRGLCVWDLLPPDIAAQRQKNMAQVFATGEVLHFDDPGVRSVYESVAYPVANNSGEVTRVVVMARDVTERRRAENELRESERRNRAMLEAIPDLIIRTSRDGVYLDIKESDLVPLVAPREELIGRPVTEMLPPEAAQSAVERLTGAVTTGKLHANEYKLVIDGEEHIFESRSVLYGPDEVLSVVRDITEQKRAEQRLVEIAVQRARVNMLMSFITNASHEFRTPLSIISLRAYLLHKDADTSRRDEYLHEINGQIESLSTLIDGLTAMTRLDSEAPLALKPLDLAQFLRWTCFSAQERAEKAGITFVCEMPEDLPEIRGHVEYLQEAFEHLLHNAVRYTPSGGTIAVVVTGGGAHIQVAIRDTGCGIAPEHQSHIFERFYRSDEAHSTRGFGLGLPIAKAIIERHGGAITFESREGVGSTFYVTLPVLESASAAPPSPAGQVHGVSD